MYSPKISERHIPFLYRAAKAQGKPMTKVVDEIITRALEEYHGKISDGQDRHKGVGEEKY